MLHLMFFLQIILAANAVAAKYIWSSFFARVAPERRQVLVFMDDITKTYLSTWMEETKPAKHRDIQEVIGLK